MKSFRWAVDKTPVWFSSEHSYRMSDATKQLELPTPQGNVIVNPGDTIMQDSQGNFSVSANKPNRKQRRQNFKTEERLTVEAIVVRFDNGQSVELDTTKVMIIDKETKAQLFNEVIEFKEKKA